MIEGISHITFIVKNLERMTKVLTHIFDAQEIYSSSEQDPIAKTKFFLIKEIWIAIIEGPVLSDRTYNHVAFKISEQDIAEYKARIKGLVLEIKESRSRTDNEGQSLYFYDFDNHLFELHTGTLQQRLKEYTKQDL